MVTYLITVKNGEKLISKTIYSILAQTTQDFEIVIVDDGSQDATCSIISKINDARIKLFKTDGVGRACALNIGVRNCKTEYIAILDADDLIHISKTSEQIKYIKKHNIDLCFTNFKVFTSDIEIETSKSYGQKEITIFEPKLLYYRNPFCHSSLICRKERLLELSGYDETLKKLVDYDLYLRAYERGYVFGLVTSPLTFKRFHAGQNFERNKRVLYLIAIFKLQINFCLKHNEIKYIPVIIAKIIYSLLPAMLRKLITNKLLNSN